MKTDVSWVKGRVKCIELVDAKKAEEGDIESAPIPAKRFSKFDEIALSGMRSFSLAAMRAYCGVGDELARRYRADLPDGAPTNIYWSSVTFPYSIVNNCGKHGYRIELLDAATYQWFKVWMLGRHFRDKVKNKYWQAHSHTAVVKDPFARLHGELNTPGILFEVYLPSGMSSRLLPDYAPTKVIPDLVSLRVEPADPAVVLTGRRMLGLVENYAD